MRPFRGVRRKSLFVIVEGESALLVLSRSPINLLIDSKFVNAADSSPSRKY